MTLIRGCDGGRGWAVNETLLSSVVDGDRVREDRKTVSPGWGDISHVHLLPSNFGVSPGKNHEEKY